jgi:glycosyltransferase involved in cell wall biosynthesis
MRVALIHEWLETYAGAEQVIEQLLAVLGATDVYALVDFLPPEQRGFLGESTVHTSFIHRLPLARKKFRSYLPLMPMAVEQFDLAGYDLVVSSNHAVAKGVLTREDQLHLCYVHTPVRYAWDLYQSYLREHRLSRGPKSWMARLVPHYLRLWDQASASRVDAFAANSRYVARRIWKTYRRRATVIHPPVDVHRFAVGDSREDFYVTVSRLVPYKRIDLMVEAFRRMPTRRLIVIGDGPELKRLATNTPPNVKLLGRQSAEVVEHHLQAARAFVFAADEDFGIAPVEAQACGTPVLAFGRGGATETVVEGRTGLFFSEQTAESIVAAVEAFEARPAAFDRHAIRAHAEQFAPERFCLRFSKFVDRQLERHETRGAMPARLRLKSPRPAVAYEHSLTGANGQHNGVQRVAGYE